MGQGIDGIGDGDFRLQAILFPEGMESVWDDFNLPRTLNRMVILNSK